MGNICSGCNKMTALETGDPEVQSVDVSGYDVSIDVRLVRLCADCGTERKEATLTLSATLERHYCEESDDWEWEVDESSLEVSADERYQDTTRGDKLIKSARYMKKFFTVEANGTARCSECGEDQQFTARDEVQAGAMDEL